MLAEKKMANSDRRMILDFPHASTDEAYYKRFLPKSSYGESWWREGVEARNIGRSLFRLHGTGMRNSNTRSKYYPFIRTRGCVATRESRYGDIEYKDQQLVLNKMMEAMGLTPKYANETKIRGLLYIVNINNEKKAVNIHDLEKLDLFN